MCGKEENALPLMNLLYTHGMVLPNSEMPRVVSVLTPNEQNKKAIFLSIKIEIRKQSID